jgi:hypothetical protein
MNDDDYLQLKVYERRREQFVYVTYDISGYRGISVGYVYYDHCMQFTHNVRIERIYSANKKMLKFIEDGVDIHKLIKYEAFAAFNR